MTKQKKLKHKNEIYAYISYGYKYEKKHSFITSPNEKLQFGFFNFDNGGESALHYHKKYKRSFDRTSEFLFILSGKAKIFFYDYNKIKINEVILKRFDSIMIFKYMHKLEYSKNTKILEIKHGPFNSYDKVLVK